MDLNGLKSYHISEIDNNPASCLLVSLELLESHLSDTTGKDFPLSRMKNKPLNVIVIISNCCVVLIHFLLRFLLFRKIRFSTMKIPPINIVEIAFQFHTGIGILLSLLPSFIIFTLPAHFR